MERSQAALTEMLWVRPEMCWKVCEEESSRASSPCLSKRISMGQWGEKLEEHQELFTQLEPFHPQSSEANSCKSLLYSSHPRTTPQSGHHQKSVAMGTQVSDWENTHRHWTLVQQTPAPALCSASVAVTQLWKPTRSFRGNMWRHWIGPVTGPSHLWGRMEANAVCSLDRAGVSCFLTPGSTDSGFTWWALQVCISDLTQCLSLRESSDEFW